MLKLVLQQPELNDFCKAVAKITKSAKFVSFSLENSVFTLSTQDLAGSVFYNTKIATKEKLTGGFSVEKFVACIKHLAEDEIHVSFDTHFMKIVQANVAVTLPLIDDTYLKIPTFDYKMPLDVVTFTVKQLKNIHSCFGNTEKASNFAGTLLDFSPNKLTVAKLNPYMLYKSSLDTDLCSFSRRLLLPSSAGDFCKTFEKKIRDIYLGYNKIAIKLNNGVAVIIPELQDDYPENYDIFFNNNASTFFLADKEELTQTINLVADVAGVENTDVSIAVAGVDPNTKNSVIKISSSLFDGTFASELLVIQNKVTQEVQETCIKSAHILSSLKAYEGTVKLVITQRSCILSDLGNTIYIVLAAREL